MIAEEEKIKNVIVLVTNIILTQTGVNIKSQRLETHVIKTTPEENSATFRRNALVVNEDDLIKRRFVVY